jgi:protein SCO1
MDNNKSKARKNTIFLISFFLVLGIGFFVWFELDIMKNPNVPGAHAQLPVLGNPGHRVDTFSFVDQEGKVITNADVQGKVYVVEYFFTTCKGICPKLNENLAKVYQAYRGNKDIRFLSHTVDPKHDTVQALKAYSQRFEADPNQWYFLTGDKQKLYNMARYSYLISAQDDTAGVSIDKDFIHDNHYVLVDRDGRVRGFYDGLKTDEVNKLIGDINTLLREKS